MVAMPCLPQYPVSSVFGAPTQFRCAHLFAGYESTLIPAKQQPRSAQRKELQARQDASGQREANLKNACAATEAGFEYMRFTADARADLQ